ncbi:DUF349 domain-containing protein [Bermanella marisrubri]|uniref:DUF349 domain-containing protein n=1 Tax=Bermanella marisrubri TaxID=207949 RepID=Q1N147_9GAMM|nr:DUF349 domain-containing protein [Bermanella marisrubri]EAT12004.1 hypothetical protein RED65_11705 [Oceanobacter sp. RED65] [Bermanella marisrubri]QIZ84809.1 DUF349 domain-containing protein [Bermanella marisrubri]
MAGFFKQLFSAKWQHKDPEVRLGAIDQSLDQETLQSIASEDTDIRVRKTAISYIESLDTLSTLYNQFAAEKETAQIIFERISKHLPNETELSILKPELLTLIAGQSFDGNLAQAAIKSIGDEQQLFQLIQNSPSAKARHLAIENIHALSLLKSIERDFKGKDKTLVRLAKDKIQAQQDQDKYRAQIQNDIQHLLQQANQLAQQAFDPLFTGKLNLIKQEWEALPEDKQRYAKEYADALQQCEAILHQNEEEQAKLDEKAAQLKQAQNQVQRTLEVAHSTYAEAKAGRVPSLDALQQLTKDINEAIVLSNKNKLTGLKADLTDFYKPLLNLEQSLTVQQKLDHTAPSSGGSELTVGDLKKDLKETQNQIKKINWPSEFPSPNSVQKRLDREAKLKEELQARKDKEANTLKQIRKELASFETALDDGQAKQAEQHQKHLKSLFSQVDVQQHKNLYGQFKALQQTLFDLNDWKGFASAPKLEALCETMQQLADNPLDGKTQLEQIQLLQEEWKAVAKASTQAQQKQHWPKFKQAKETAFVVCNEYFAQQAEHKQANKQARQEICLQLEQFFEQNDWIHSDFKAIVELIGKAKQEYKRFAPVEQSDHKPLQNRFYNAVKAIEKKVDEHYQNIADEKQTLIKQVSELLSHDDLNDAIEQCKEIQEQWKHIGNAGRKENTLWKAFRAECDKLFDRRKQANEQHKQAIQAEISEANALVDGVAQEVHEGRGNLNGIQQIRQDIRNLNIPNKVRAGIEGKLDKLADSVKQQHQLQKQQALFSQWQSIADLAEHMTTANEHSEAVSKLNLDKSLQPIKRVAVQAIESNETLSEETQQALCIELDITLGKESPSEEQALRMAAQVKRLQESIGQGANSRNDQIIDLATQWLSAVPEQDSQYRERFWNTLIDAVKPKTKNATTALVD